MSGFPKISVITPSYNQGKFIRQTIESVLNQKYPSFEHIVIDGGSTDETVEVLKSYPHLNWISESDKGQADAVNKALARATGDLIAWINSDDYYAENIFVDVVKALEIYPIVLGACEVVDGNGKTLDSVENHPRTWFDMLKYWVPYSIPAQPAIFFRREILDEVKRPDGTWLDSSLDFCMDYDLWMRICQRHPLTNRLNKVLAYYRMTGDNKTGGDALGMRAAEPEMSRVFNRYKDIPLTVERQLSFVIPTPSLIEISVLLESLTTQTLLSGEVVCVCSSKESQREVATRCQDLNNRMLDKGKNFHFRVMYHPGSYIQAINAGINEAQASLIACIDPSYTADSSLVHEIFSLFSKDRFGAALPLKSNYFSSSSNFHSEAELPINEIASIATIPQVLVARKIALVEIDGFDESLEPQKALKKAIEMLFQSGWSVSTANNIRAVQRN